MVGDLNLKNKLLVIYDKMLQYFKQYKKNRILKIKCIICVFVSILFIVATYCSSFMLTDKLSETEYTEISELYNEMQRITEIRNKEYVITDLKKIDREKVYHNLRQDSIQYAMIVSRNAFNFYKEGRKADEVRDYIIRCDLTFENIEGLKAPEDVFYYSKMFFQEDTTDLNRLATYSSDISKIVESEQKILDKIGYLNGVKTFFVIMLYLLVLFGIFKSKVIGKVINNI
jgi:hypothetical protein